MSEAVESNWAMQEKRLGRTPTDLATLSNLMSRARLLERELQHSGPNARPNPEVRELLDRFEGQLHSAGAMDQDRRLELYRDIRRTTREMALSNPLLANKPVVFMKRHRFICQMLHEYLGYFYDYGDVAGGSVCILEEPGRSFKVRELTRDKLPRGNYTTLALSYDGKTAWFGFARRAAAKPEFHSAGRESFHLYGLELASGEVRQLTSGPDDDFDPCPLPDGGIAFMSARRGGFGRCHNPWEPLQTYTLHRIEPDGSGLKTLSFHETNEWHPFVANDGRIIYTRWDYVDRSAANFHGLWFSSPDGSGSVSLFGNYTTRINALFQPHPIPGSDRILFVAGAHHANVGGGLVMVDPRRCDLDPATGEDRLEAVELLTPEICHPEAAGWPKSYFHSPWPLSENFFLTALSLDPLPGMSSGESRDTRTGLYYFDRFGNLELLYSDPEFACMYPIPLEARKVPPRLASNLNPEAGETGELVVQDLNRSLMPLPPGRRVVSLRVWQILPKTGSHIANKPRLGHANAESARMLLGSVPVEADGSAYFRAPARKPLYFQAVDEKGRAVQTMRSAAYLQPGETRGCIGCHERPRTSPRVGPLQAVRRPVSEIEAGPDGSRPLSYARLVQPVLDRYCVRCHDGQPGPGRGHTALSGRPAREFSESYASLKPYVRWHEWGGDSISQIATRPGYNGADASPLTTILEDANHGTGMGLPDGERRRIYLWLDANAPFYGTYDPAEQIAQRAGESIALPRVQ